MASSDEYQQIQFWEKLKELPFGPICVESNDKGECLMSAEFVVIDISKPKTWMQEQEATFAENNAKELELLFCKTYKNENTISKD